MRSKPSHSANALCKLLATGLHSTQSLLRNALTRGCAVGAGSGDECVGGRLCGPCQISNLTGTLTARKWCGTLMMEGRSISALLTDRLEVIVGERKAFDKARLRALDFEQGSSDRLMPLGFQARPLSSRFVASSLWLSGVRRRIGVGARSNTTKSATSQVKGGFWRRSVFRWSVSSTG